MFKLFVFLASSFVFPLFSPTSAEADQEPFTIFCTGNHDATGSCLEVSNSEEYNELDCIMVPETLLIAITKKKAMSNAS